MMAWFRNALPLDLRTAASVRLLKKQRKTNLFSLCPRLRVLLPSAVIVFGFCSVFISLNLRRIFVTQPMIGALQMNFTDSLTSLFCCLCICLHHTVSRPLPGHFCDICRSLSGAALQGLNQRLMSQHCGALQAKTIKKNNGPQRWAAVDIIGSFKQERRFWKSSIYKQVEMTDSVFICRLHFKLC